MWTTHATPAGRRTLESPSIHCQDGWSDQPPSTVSCTTTPALSPIRIPRLNPLKSVVAPADGLIVPLDVRGSQPPHPGSTAVGGEFEGIARWRRVRSERRQIDPSLGPSRGVSG